MPLTTANRRIRPGDKALLFPLRLFVPAITTGKVKLYRFLFPGLRHQAASPLYQAVNPYHTRLLIQLKITDSPRLYSAIDPGFPSRIIVVNVRRFIDVVPAR